MLSYRMLLVWIGSALIGFTIPSLATPAEDGAKIFGESCSSCHTPSARPIDDKHLTREQWKEASERMIDLGAQVPKGKKLELLLDYLVSTQGPEGTGADTGKK